MSERSQSVAHDLFNGEFTPRTDLLTRETIQYEMRRDDRRSEGYAVIENRRGATDSIPYKLRVGPGQYIDQLLEFVDEPGLTAEEITDLPRELTMAWVARDLQSGEAH